MSSKSRFDIEFTDDTVQGEPLVRHERVPFERGQTVRALRRELEYRSGWKNFDLFVRSGGDRDGTLLHLNERDALDDAVDRRESKFLGSG
jgi:hypothetical protein